MRPGDQSIERNECYAEDTEITAQIHLTLADLDAELADGTRLQHYIHTYIYTGYKLIYTPFSYKCFYFCINTV